METIFPFALWCFTSLFTITSPLSTMPVFLTMTQSLDEKERRAVAIRSTLVACCALLLFVLAGQFLFKFFGISTNGFRIVGGIIIFRIGFDMLQAKYTPMNLRKCQRCFRGSFGNPFTMRAGCDCQCDCPDAGSPFV